MKYQFTNVLKNEKTKSAMLRILYQTVLFIKGQNIVNTNNHQVCDYIENK